MNDAIAILIFINLCLGLAYFIVCLWSKAYLSHDNNNTKGDNQP